VYNCRFFLLRKYNTNCELMIETFALIIDAQMQNVTRIYTVSQVNSLIKEILENNLPGRLTIS
jgi:hypothetical protein